MASVAIRQSYRVSKRKTRKKSKVRKSHLVVSRQRALLRVMVIGAVFLVVVLLSAASADIKRENNSLENSNSYLQAQIDAISSSINDATNISVIEDVAVNRLGMVCPGKGNCVSVDGKKASEINLASSIKREAYS